MADHKYSVASPQLHHCQKYNVVSMEIGNCLHMYGLKDIALYASGISLTWNTLILLHVDLLVDFCTPHMRRQKYGFDQLSLSN